MISFNPEHNFFIINFNGKSCFYCPLYLWVLSTWLLLGPSISLAQPNQYAFDHLSIEDGLSQNFIYSIEQDHRGFLWFSTKDGLNRYDGYEFKVYSHIPGDSNSLSDNVVMALCEDSRNNLWVGAGGLDRYNRLNDRVERIFTAEDFKTNIPTFAITYIEEDHQGDLWVAVQNAGLFRIEFSNENASSHYQKYFIFGPYDVSGHQNFNDPDYGIRYLLSTPNGLWITHPTGISRLKTLENGKFAPPEEAAFEHISFAIKHEHINRLVYATLFLDKANALWISTSFGLVCLPNPDAPTHFRYFPYPSTYFDKAWLGMGKKMVKNVDGKIWLGTYAGLLIFDPATGAYHKIQNEPNLPESLSFDNITDIMIDKSNVIWLGTAGLGINKYTGHHKHFRHYLDRKLSKQLYSVYSILEDSTNRLWFTNSLNQIYALNKAAADSAIFLKQGKEWSITYMTKGRKGLFWLINNHELIKFNPYTQDIKRFPMMEWVHSMDRDSVPVLHVNRPGELWICNTGTLRHFNPVTEKFQVYDLPALNLEQINSLYHDENGVFWIGSHQGLLRFDMHGRQSRLFKAVSGVSDSLNHKRINCILPDPEQPERFLWIGTGGGGLNKFDKVNEVFTVFTQDDGLPNNFIYGILADNAGKLWISTNQGLSKFDPSSEKFENFLEKDGLQSNEFNSKSFFKNEEGELFFGGINGITAFFPEDIVPNSHIPPIVFTDMLLSYESIQNGKEDTPLTYSVTETKEVHLNYFENNIAFEFAALDFTAPSKNQYLYKLEGFDKGWVTAGKERRASYTNLPPGTYNFQVKGTNNDGILNEQGAKMKILIAPPLWKTWWAYLCYVIILFFIVFFIYRYNIDRIKMREALHIKNLENEKLAELDQFKSNFFANISHEFRTPITIIQGQVDTLMNQINEADIHSNLSVIKKSSFQMIKLIDQLLDIARLETSKMNLKQSPGNIVHFLHMLTVSLQSSAESKEQSLNFHSEVPRLFIPFDQDAVQKIFQNLIANAIKFTPAHGEIFITLEKGEQDGVKIQITDNGIGIPPEELSNIFDRFYQANHNHTPTGNGFGLGLALVKELVALHGGKVEVESHLHEGTTFTVYLPGHVQTEQKECEKAIDAHLLNVALADFEDIKSKSTPLAIEKIVAHEKMDTLLLVEDNQELRSYIAKTLSSQFKVIQAANGQEGLAQAIKHIPDLIISDIMMPHMDGYELSQHLKTDQRTSHIPLILLTAKAEMPDKIKGLELGVDDYLVKPFHATELKTRVSNLIKIREALKLKYAQSFLPSSSTTNGNSLEDSFLNRVICLIKENLGDEHFSVEILADEIGMSASQLYRKIKALTGLSTLQLLQRYRLEKATAYLKQGYSVSEVSYMVGVNSPAYFSQLFKKYFGYSPKDYNQKKLNTSQSRSS